MNSKNFTASSFCSAVLRFLIAGCLMVFLGSGFAFAAEEELPETEEVLTTPYEEHGQLSVVDTNLVDQNGEAFQLRGISTHGLAWYPQYVNEDTFRFLRDNWDINAIRLAMYTAEDRGYCVTDDAGREVYKQFLTEAVEAASDLGLYVIIDWHILSDYDPNWNRDMAMSFFSDISKRLQDYNNVLYEICNEPNSGTTWDAVTGYALNVIDSIRGNAPDSIIIVGTPTWCQDVDVAAAAPIARPNLLYSLHFYASSHRDELRAKAEAAYHNGLPLIVSEFGISDASGNGEISTEEGDMWLSMLDQYKISYFMWNLSNKDESSSIIRSDCTKTSDWTEDELTESGQWYLSRLTGEEYSVTYPASSALLFISSGSNTNNNNGNNNNSVSSDDTWEFDNGCTVTVTAGNHWTQDNTERYEYSVTIINTTQTPINSWRIRIVWDNTIEPTDYWNCEIGGSGSSRLFVPKEYNTRIDANASVNFGFIMSTATAPSIVDVTFE